MSKMVVWLDSDAAILAPSVRPLEQAGYQLVRLTSVRAALEAVEQIRRADLILLDPYLPSGDHLFDLNRWGGLDLLRELRCVHRVMTPAIIFTTLASLVPTQPLATLGVIGIISKPVLPLHLKSQIEQALLAST